MLYKEATIAVMVAVMLGAASLFGGLSIIPALATHDSDAVELATKQVTQEDDESVVIEAIELNAKKLTSRVTGTVTVEIIQDGDVLESANLGTAALKTSFSTIEVDVTNINVTGSFEILAEFVGSGVVTVNAIDFVEGTEVAGDGGNGGNNDDDDSDAGNENPSSPQEEELENVIATKTIAQDGDESMTVEVVEFSAKKLTSRVTGTVTVALVQNDNILDEESFRVSDLKTSYTSREAAFDEEITGDFDVVFMHEGSGAVYVNGINVPGSTQTGENPPTNPPPTNPGDTIELTVNAVDEAGNEIPGMWVEVYSGMSASGEPVTTGGTPGPFELEAGEYIVAMGDFEDNIFQRWEGSPQDSTREETLTSDTTFTAVYSTDGSQPPGQSEPPTTSPPPTSEAGSITAYAYRIPSEHWGPTFTGANAEMWFVLYNSTGWIVHSGFYDENGSTVTGLNDGETYYIYATDCDECHDDPHNVEFRHWQDNDTLNPRAITPGMTAGAYYEFVPPS